MELEDLVIVYRDGSSLNFVYVVKHYTPGYLWYKGDHFNPEAEARQDFGEDFVRVTHIYNACDLLMLPATAKDFKQMHDEWRQRQRAAEGKRLEELRQLDIERDARRQRFLNPDFDE